MTTEPFDDRDGFIWMNGELIPWRDATAHVLTHAMHYGSSVFEGERAYSGQIFKSDEHTARLFRSAEMLDIKVPFTESEINAAKEATLKESGLTDAYVRPIVWRGSKMMGVSAQDAGINAAIAVWPWPSYWSPEKRMQGIKLAVSRWQRPSPDTIPCLAKAAGLYMICTLSKHEAERDGFDDALMYDYRGYIAEATGANVFFVIDGALHTPTPDCFLDGITRRTVIALAKEQGLDVIERHMMPEEMGKATECFLTGTAAEVTPVSQIGDYRFTPAGISRSLMEAYDTLVGKQG